MYKKTFNYLYKYLLNCKFDNNINFVVVVVIY